MARPELGWNGFHGFDWDIEGTMMHGRVERVCAHMMYGVLCVCSDAESVEVVMGPMPLSSVYP